MPELLNTAGSVASVVGALGSAWFWLRARGEARTAHRLVRGAQRRQLVDDLTRMCGALQLIATALTPEELAAARHLAEQLRAEAVALSARHRAGVPEGVARSLLGARRRTHDLAKELAVQQEPGADRRAVAQSLIDLCMTELADARGCAQGAIDSSDAEGER